MIKHRKRNTSQRPGFRFQQKRKDLNENPLIDLCKYIIIVFLFFMLMYVFMLSVSSIPLGSDQYNIKPNNTPSTEINIASIPKPDATPRIKQPELIKNENDPKHPINDYIVFNGYMARLVGGISQGLFEKFESRHQHKLVQLYCDSLQDECIGYAFNKNGGYQFYSKNAWPMNKKKGWNFYMKQDPNKPLSLRDTGLDANDMDNESKQKYIESMNDDDEQQENEELLNTDNKDKDKNTDNNKLKVKIDDNINNGIIKDEISKKVDNDKYISYAQNVGRVNNQLVSFEAMIQYALYYNRTLVIPWPRHQNHVMGFECGFWDFHRLREIIDIIMEDELPESLQNYREETGIPTECRFIKLIGDGIPNEANNKCKMIYLYEGEMGIFHFQNGPKDVMKYIIPAKYIRDAVEEFLISEFGELRYRIGVHRRAMSEGGIDAKTKEIHVCRWESRGIHGDSRFLWLRDMIKKKTGSDRETYNKIIAMYHHSCAMDFYDLQNILIFHKQKPIENGEKFFIAHDHQEQWIINDMKKYGGIEQPNGRGKEKYSSYFWSSSEKAYKKHKSKCRDYGHCATQKTLKMKEEILWDMWSLSFAEFLAGTWMSTLTRTICHWKGEEKSMYNGNQCFLKWKWKNTINHINDQWYTLDGVNITALFD